jgi:lipid-binding SYLF domain-containing protein
MTTLWTLVAAGVTGWLLPASAVPAGEPEAAILRSADEVLKAFAGIAPRGIPPALLQNAQGVAIFPNVLKAGFGIGGRYGRGVVLVRGPGGAWGNPMFLRLLGGGVGWQIGVQSTDIILVFKTKNGLNRFLRGKGKLTLGGDAAVAAGPVGRQAEAATDAQLKAEIYSYSRSRGLFAGLSLEGAGILADHDANEDFYRLRGGRPADVLALHAVPLPAAKLQVRLSNLCAPPPPPPRPAGPPQLLVPVPAAPPPPPPVSPPPR